MTSKKFINIILVVAIVGLITFVILQSSSRYLYVSEVVANSKVYVGTYVRVIGNVSRIVSINYSEGSITFSLTDGKSSINVKYRQSLPTNWREKLTVAAIGRLTKEDLIEADQILTQCPSRYAT